MDTTIVKATPIDGPPEEQNSSDIISFADLPTEEQEITQTAIEETEYRKCYFDLPSAEQDAVSSLESRGCYLKRGEEYYELSGAVLDDAIC
ncbi:hypothetical protein EL22_25610 [Halostagnicola sp. A56]|uniref:hypothetical protein n=1 Tax=Halostagnicola sp. A56 TaxID=1495067 RepID=UPI0004A03FC7|nr:hypothetical protein [Halostagnicola sp. A56]KDE56649.1 hypothetical protein EL22_25610 [Halostagnicola sp. A56]